MTPRPKIIWLNQNDPHEQIWHKIVVSRHSHFPVYSSSRDHVIGTVSVKAIYAHLAAALPVKLRDLAVPPLIVPEPQLVLQLVESFKQTGKHIAMVTDEFGSIVGLVTLNDIVEALVGEFETSGERARPEAKKRDDGSWLIDATIDLESVERALPGMSLGGVDSSDYQTLAGFLLKRFGSIPKEGQTLTYQGYVFEVLDMDGHRIDKVLVLPVPSPSLAVTSSGPPMA
jgi:putative hemolysin